MNAMVIYRSKTGSTEEIAKRVAKDSESPSPRVETDAPYGGSLSICVCVIADRLQRNLPESVTKTPDASDCDTLFLGFPVWWDDMPDYYKESLRRLEANGKCLIPFATPGRSDMSRAIESLWAPFPNAEIRNPLHSGIMQRDDYALWKRELPGDAATEDAIR